jgi:hypothetical protein
MTGYHRMRNVVLGLLLAGAVVAGARATTSTTAPSSLPLESACQAIATEIGNCGCAARFLSKHLGPSQGMVMLKVWAAGEGRLGDTSRAFAAIYREHNANVVAQATRDFFQVRSDFQLECRPPGAMFQDEEQIIVTSGWWRFY